MPVRTASVVYVGDAASLIRASQQAAAANEVATAKIAAANDKIAASHAKVVTAAQKSAVAFGKWGSITGVAVIGASVDMAIKVEKASAAIAQAGDTSTAAGKKIEDAFKNLGSLEYSAAKVGEAFATIAGELKSVEGHALNASKATEVMTAALNLADATGGELKGTTEDLGKVMLTFGLHANKAAEASDILFTASKMTGLSVDTFTTMVDKARGRLGVLAPSLKDTSALMVELAKQGVTGRLTMGALGGAFGTLLSQSTKVKDQLKQLNVHVFNSKGAFVGWKSVIEQLQPALGKYNQASQLIATRTLFGEKASKQLLEIIHQGPSAFDAATRAVAKHGAAAEAAAKQHHTLDGEMRIAKAELANLSSDIGKELIPAFAKAAKAIADGVKWLKEHNTAAKALAIVISGVLGLAMTVFAGEKVAKFVKGIELMVSAAKLLAVKMGITAAAVTAADGEMVASTEAASVSMKAALMTTGIGAAVVALGTASVELGTHWKEVSEGMENAAQSMANFVIARLNEVIEGINKLSSTLTLGLMPAIGKIGEISGAGQATAQEARITHGGVMVEGAIQGAKQHVLDTGGGIMAYFMSKGLSAAQAAGIVGNIQQESGFNPRAVGKEGARGLAQGLGDRAETGSIKQQLNQIWRELASHGLAALKRAHTPSEAARAFEEGFEQAAGGGNLSQRERYAEKAYKSHPQAHSHAQRAAEEYGSGTLPSLEAQKKHKKASDLSSQIDRWAEHAVGKFAESWGKNTGPELDALQKEFHTHAASWCAEFATTAAMMGGANKAVRTASVATIREWAAQGSHGYKKGISHTPHVGNMMMFGNSHVGFVQSVHGDKVTTIEGNTSAGKVATRTHSVSEGDYASPIYHSLKTGAVLLKQESKAYEEAVKKAEHLLLTAGQKAFVGRMTAAAEGSHAMAMGFASGASSLANSMGLRQGRWAAHPVNLATKDGATTAHQRDELVIGSDKAKKKYYERELKAMQKEVNQWSKLRDSYRKFARHVHGKGAKHEALTKAAEYDAKVKQAQGEAKELEGTIYSTETEIEEANTAMNVTLPEEVQSADLGAYQQANAKIDAEERAGILTPDQAKKAKEDNANKALAGGYGPLSAEGILQVKGDFKEFSQTMQEANSIQEQNNQLKKEANKLLDEFNKASAGLLATENASLLKTLTDMMNGQIGGRPQAYGAGRGAFAGGAARY